jgi:trigger factor
MSEPKSFSRVFDIEIPEEDITNASEEKQNKYRKEINLPGFRKGKVPAAIIKSRFGQAIRAEVIEDLIQKSFEDACKQNNIQPICEAKLSDLKAEGPGPVTFKIETEVDPVIEIRDYKKIKARANPKKIKNSDIDDAIKELQDRVATLKDVERPSKSGDYLTFEYISVTIDGQPRTDFSNPKYPVELGSGKIKDFDKGLANRSAGETFDLKIKFPKDYSEEAVAGKTGEFQIKLVKVQEKILPDINEEFLKNAGDFKTEEELRERLRTDLEAHELDRAKNEAYNDAMETLIKKNPFDIPDSRVERYIDYALQEAEKYRKQDQPAPKREEIAEKYRDAGINAIKRHRIIDFIASAENIKATQEEVDERIRQMSAMYNQQFEELKQALRKNGGTERIRADLREQKTLDFLINQNA